MTPGELVRPCTGWQDCVWPAVSQTPRCKERKRKTKAAFSLLFFPIPFLYKFVCCLSVYTYAMEKLQFLNDQQSLLLENSYLNCHLDSLLPWYCLAFLFWNSITIETTFDDVENFGTTYKQGQHIYKQSFLLIKCLHLFCTIHRTGSDLACYYTIKVYYECLSWKCCLHYAKPTFLYFQSMHYTGV